MSSLITLPTSSPFEMERVHVQKLKRDELGWCSFNRICTCHCFTYSRPPGNARDGQTHIRVSTAHSYMHAYILSHARTMTSLSHQCTQVCFLHYSKRLIVSWRAREVPHYKQRTRTAPPTPPDIQLAYQKDIRPFPKPSQHVFFFIAAGTGESLSKAIWDCDI